MEVVDKSRRYDRQIRIWGSHGQRNLENSKVALINCSATGSEVLKNLVLGGIASFCIVDNAKVTRRDLGNNFLVEHSHLGESRAKVVTALLQELNESVAGSYVEEDPSTLMSSNPAFFSNFTLVIATQVHELETVRLDELCRQMKIPLLVARSYGLVGYLRVSVPEHLVIESKPDNSVDDLRLHSPFPELLEFVNSFDLINMDDLMHQHIPFVVLLLKAAEKWRKLRDGVHSSAVPSAEATISPVCASKDRAMLKDIINGMRRQSPEGLPTDHANFDEALKAAFHVHSPPVAIPSEVQSILDDSCATQLTAESDDFWIIVSALKSFMDNEGNGQLPLQGSIPDMHALTDLYLSLQHLYRDKAEADVSHVEARVQALLKKLGRDSNSISRETVRLICRNARNLRLVRYRTLMEEFGGESSSNRGCSVLQIALHGEQSSLHEAASVYVLLRAADKFFAAYGRYPGCYDGQIEADVPALKSLTTQILNEVGATGSSVSDDCVVEMCRFGAAELHVIAAVMGGMAAQEVIKVITKQFTPAPGTLIYNGIHATMNIFYL
ncbi:hypothetical protein CEUSTIGMA_g7731.t1 [Chlamydomonas eustigma]|uniref:NEDD8-activating enzyme E1 regulatory subunit n=1 Tax=Chlamydomonas eustigma TaxID=1157962 RepID=A0A250XB24_9CHLO|nr:hypothetical protein CEUSTIGMA_g7731.t1 [Chlamydomonas eustigma]|eukprot:GAX80293.1 hypothetical protein CEUSTIGMA_g7731.t1 [Chlamydomonas eustigma]